MTDPFAELYDEPQSVNMGQRVELDSEDITFEELEAINREYERLKLEEMKTHMTKTVPEEMERSVLEGTAKTVAPMALGGAGGIVTRQAVSKAPALIRWLAEIAGSTVGETVGTVATDGKEGMGDIDFTSVNPLSNPLIPNFGIPAAAKGSSSFYRYFRPNKTKIALDASEKSGVVTGKLGGLSSEVERRALGGKLQKTEDEFLDSRVWDEVPKDSKNPLLDLSENSTKRIQDLRLERGSILKEADSRLPPEPVFDLDKHTRQRHQKLSEQGIAADVNEEGIRFAEKELNKKRQYFQNSERAQMTTQELQKEIDDINEILRDDAFFDTIKTKAAETGRPSAEAVTPIEEGYLYLRDYFQDLVNKRTGGKVAPLNREMEALYTYRPVATNSHREARAKFAPTTGSANVPKSPMGIVTDAAAGGEAAQEARRMSRAVLADSEVFNDAKKIRDFRTGRAKPGFGYKTGQELAKPSMQIALGKGGLKAFLGDDTQPAMAEEPSIMEPPQDPYANGVPRTSEAFTMPAMVRLVANMEQSAKADPMQLNKMTIAKQLGMKLAEAERTGDFKKKQRIVADLAKLAPEHFEPGRGIDNKLFHPDDQQEYMEELQRLERSGKVSSIFMAKQRDSFLDRNDGTIMELESELQKSFQPKEKPQASAGTYPTPKQYAY